MKTDLSENFPLIFISVFFTILLVLANIVFKDIPHIFYFNVLVDDQGTITEFKCFCYKEYYDKFEFIGSSGPSEVKKKDGRTIEISGIRGEL